MKKTLLIISILFSFQLYAKNQAACDDSIQISGDSCETLKVSFDSKKCGLKEIPEKKVQISCQNNKAEVSQTFDKAKLEARLKLTQKGWSQAEWNLKGRVKKIEIPSGSTNNVRQVAAEPAAEKKAELSIKFSGYLDVRLSTLDNHKNASLDSGNAESGFGLEDGAFYINVEKEKYSLVVDLPVRRFKDADDNPGTGNNSNNSKILIGGDKAQLYGRIKAADHLILNVGQFDTPYGVEVNDSKDRYFNKTGLVYDATLPVTHTGVLAEIPLNIFTLKVFSANSNNKGSLGNSTTGDNQYEYGTAFSGAKDNWRFQLGAMARPITKANGTSKGARTLYDATAGATFDKLSVDVEYSVLSDESKNTLTPSDSADKEKDGSGAMLLLTYQLRPEWNLGARIEHLDQDPAAASNKTVDSSAFGVHYKPHGDYELRSEYITTQYKKVDGSKWDQTRFNLGVLFFF